jgi:hypothetical protein
MRNALEAALTDLEVMDDGNKFPKELRGVRNTRKLLALIRKYGDRVIDEINDLNGRLLDLHDKNGSLRDENSRIKDRLVRAEAEVRDCRLGRHLEQLELPMDDRRKILEFAR